MSIASVDSNSTLGLATTPLAQNIKDAGQQEQSVLRVTQDKLVKGAQAISQQMQQEALRRLQELQEKMVGGEKKNDQRLKEKRKERKAYAVSRREKLIRAVKKMEDDGIMVKVYDNLQDEIKAKNKIVEELDVKLKASRLDIEDLQVEFERDREDFLETIRKQEQTIKLQQQILDKIQPCIRRDCNYFNIDRVKNESSWDEEASKWNIPELVVTKTTLPAPGIMPGGGMPSRGGRKSPISRAQINNQGQVTNGYSGGYPEEHEEDKFLQHLSKSSSGDFAASYFKPKRADRLLAETRFEKRDSTPPGGSRTQGGFPAPLGPAGGFGPGQPPPGGSGVGQLLNRPVRLESLNVSGEKEKRKKKNRHSQERQER